MLLLWAVISAGLLAVALALNTSGDKACIRSMGTVCPSPLSGSGPRSTGWVDGRGDEEGGANPYPPAEGSARAPLA